MAFGKTTDDSSLEKTLETLLTRLTEQSANQGISGEQLEKILAATGLSVAGAMKSSLKPENADHPHISAFSYPEGDVARPKPLLSRKTFYMGMEEKEDRLTPAEIDAFNAITEHREARNGTWKAEFRHKGLHNEELWVSAPCESVDQRMELPPLTLLLQELNGGPSTSDLYKLIAEVKQLREYKAQQQALTGTVPMLQASLG